MRKFMKQLIKVRIIAEWSSQNRIEELKHKTAIDWSATFNSLNKEERPLARIIFTKASIIKSFKVKMMINQLPTLLNIYYRDKNKEIDPKCPRCGNEYEDQVHWIWCTENKYTMKQVIKEILEALERGKS